jgi:TPR repeat protein
VEQSYNEAVKWFTLAAEQGDAKAQCSIGFCYENGYGVEKSFNEAAEWYKKAAAQGDEEAKKKLDFMEL